ncbi:MAG: Ig-like domain-containing protein [Thermodesulfobacteriota bacterium]|nr:Ig-like domain-containing protein [Thermodesulfobacteriota bacterium]
MKFKYTGIVILIVLMTFLLAGCGSSGGGDDGGGSDSGDSAAEENGGGATASMTLSADPTSIPADGSGSTSITATLTDDAGNAVAQGTSVTFSTTLGTLSSGTTTTPDDTGVVIVSLIAGTTAGPVTVTATSNNVTQTTSVTFTESGGDATASSIKLSADPISVKSDNSDSSIITANVLDASNAVIEGITVVFSAGGGQISASFADTDANGKAQINFSSGTLDPSNQVVTITGTVSGLSSQVPVEITGSNLTLSTDNSNITNDGSTTATLIITAKDAGERPVYDIPLTLSVSGDGGAILSASSGNTNSSGELQVTVTGTNAGLVTITALGLGTMGTQAYTVSSVGALFGITSPTTDPCLLSTNTDLTIIVNAPGLTNVQFATTLGSLTGSGETGRVIEVAVAGGTASAVFRSSQAGLATIQVFDPDNTSTSDTMGVAITAPSVDAARITLQSSTYVVAPSSGGISNTATLTATVRTSDLQVVSGAPVAFSIENPTGGGEAVSPVVVYTDSSGVATTTFTSGSLPSVEPVIVSARVVGEGTTGPLTNLSFNNSDPDTITRPGGSFIDDGFEDGEQIRVQGSADNDGIYIIEKVAPNTLTLDAGETLLTEAAGATVTITAVAVALDPGITIGGTAGSVVIGRGSEITVLNPTTYALPMSVLVADSNGNAVAGAVVSLSTWPSQYSAGTWYDEDPDPEKETFVPYISGTFDNEDLNENTFLDPGEDTNGDGLLTPHNSAAGTLPTTVTTDENGVANFDLVYLKEHANWIRDRIRASTLVLGTETTASTIFHLPYERSEGEAGDLHDSPYPVVLTVAVGGTTVYTFPVFTDTDTDTFTSSSDDGSFAAAPNERVYTYTEPGTGSVGDVIMDYVTIEGTVYDPVTGASSEIKTIVPVQIIIQ